MMSHIDDFRQQQAAGGSPSNGAPTVADD
jgi:hypothetical protein